jgi:pilus assembly protein Flp/PilA
MGQGTPRPAGQQDHSAICSVDCGPYAAGTIFEERRYHYMIRDFISSLLARFQSEDEEGQTLVEYGLLLALIAIIVIVALLFLGPLISNIFSNVGNQLT